jgi:hypothetical protein
MSKLKVGNAWMAPGYWGNDPASHIASLHTAERVLALNYDKMRAMGLPFKVWRRVDERLALTVPRTLQCSCYKDTSQQSDVPCLSCYGQKIIPGYVKWGYETVAYASIHTDLTLVNMELNRQVAPFRLQLTSAATTGTITTPLYTVVTPATAVTEYKVDGYPRDPLGTITTQFSFNSGVYQPIANLATITLAVGNTLQFQITITRPAITNKTPVFEILRFRFPIVQQFRVHNTAGPLDGFSHQDTTLPGEILLLKTWDQERFAREVAGTNTSTEGQRYWTLPLSFFDERIDRESPDAVLGRDHFVEEARGPEAGVRYVATRHAFSRTFKIFTRMDFNLRRVIGDQNDRQGGEGLMKVW